MRGVWRIVVGLLACVALVGCSSSGVDAENGFAAGTGTYTRIAPAKRAKAPVIEGTTLDGKHLSTSQYLGKVVVINVWGSWCAPCRHEAPALEKAAEQTTDVAQFVGINTRDLAPAPAQAFVRAFGITYPSLYDPDGALLLQFGQAPPTAIPSTIVLDRQGRVAARVLGETTESTITGIIHDVAEGR